jgi:hypothetical protein
MEPELDSFIYMFNFKNISAVFPKSSIGISIVFLNNDDKIIDKEYKKHVS